MKKLAPHSPVKYGFDGGSSPPDAAVDGGKFTASFDNRLWMFHRSWEPPPNQQVRATLMIVHGTVDHSGVYDELANYLVSKSNIAVFAMDMRGWGLSDGESMYMDSIDTFCEDVNHLYREIHHNLHRYKHVKARFLLGKSIGGSVTAFAAARYPDHWTGLIGLSGVYDPGLMPSKTVQWIMGALARMKPKLPVKRLFDDSLIVSDPAALQKIREDKLCSKDPVRVGYVVTAISCLQLMTTIASQINLPMLMMYGEDDQVVTLAGHQLMMNKNQNDDTQLKVYQGARHNLLQEPSCKAQVMQDIQEWIVAHSLSMSS